MAYICQKELTADYKGATSGDHRWCFRPVNNRQSSRRVRALLTALALGALSGCGGDSGTGIRPAVVTVEPGEALIVGAGGSLGFSAMVRDESGRPVSGSVTWTVADPQVATIDAVGIATGVSAGTTTVIATAGSARGTARLEVFVPEKIAEYESGKSYWGRGNYVQYIPGELPVVFSATHGGLLIPAEIPNRSYGVTTSDRNTMELTQAIRRAFVEQTGFAPHVIISHLRRRKLDPNREIVEAAQGNPYAEQAWRELHAWIRTARAVVEERFGRGMYFDIHGHSHDIDRLELGYLLDASELDRFDALLDAPQIIARSSIRELAQGSALPFPELLRGGPSLGGLLQDEGVRTVPSPGDPSPGAAAYFRGGYNTREYGSRSSGEVISGVQIEHHFPGLRDTEANRRAYAAKLARVIRRFMRTQYGFFEPASLQRQGP